MPAVLAWRQTETGGCRDGAYTLAMKRGVLVPHDMSNDQLVLMGCGDVGPIHEPVDTYSELARATLATADLRVAQCERVYSERGALQVHSGGEHSRVAPHMASVFTDCKFDVLSMASNHAMDWGEVAMLDTIGLLNAKGIRTVGAGRNLDAARQPVIIEHRGVTIAFLAYCSVLRDGYAAEPHKAGVAPLRAHTYYEPMEYQAGTPPRVVTVPYEEDLAALLEDIAAVKTKAQVVVLILHWGIHFIPKVIADYQTTIARAAFDAGVDLILGHHAHVPKAIEVYRGNVCFYSLSNFIMSAPEASQARMSRMVTQYGVALNPDYPRLPYGTDAKRTLIARAVCTPHGVQRVSFLPTLIDKQLRPEVLRHDDPRFDEAVRYMAWVSDAFDPRLQIYGDEVVIGAG